MPTSAWEAAEALRAGDAARALAYLESLPTYRPPRGELAGPMRAVVGQPRVVRGGAWERLACGHEAFVASSHKPGTRKRRHCAACGGGA